MSDQSELFDSEKLRWWQWHGRQMFTEVRNDFRFSRKLREVVYHLADVCQRRTESEARKYFREEYPDAQETGFFCGGEVSKKDQFE